MKEIQVVMSDDLWYAETGERVTADETVTLALDGEVRELDLTAAHAAELRELLAGWMKAGHPPARKQRSETATETGPRPGGHMESRAFTKRLREFADAHGLRSSDGQRPVYITPKGAYYYPYRLRAMYEAAQRAEVERALPGSVQDRFGQRVMDEARRDT